MNWKTPIGIVTLNQRDSSNYYSKMIFKTPSNGVESDNWEAAKSKCSGHSASGYAEWRLPSYYTDDDYKPISNNLHVINQGLSKIGGSPLSSYGSYFWTSTETGYNAEAMAFSPGGSSVQTSSLPRNNSLSIVCISDVAYK